MSPDPMADLLTDTLRERTEATEYPSTPIATVAARARRVRARRRRTTTLAAAAAVAVVAGSSALWLGRSPDSSTTPSNELSSGPTIPSTVHSTAPAPVSLDALPVGRKPGVDYLRHSDYVAATGTTTRLPLQEITDATPYLGGFLVEHTGPDLGPRLTWLDNRLHAQWTKCGNGLTLSGDRTLLAFVTDDCTSDLATIHLGIPSGMSNGDQTDDVRGLPVDAIGIARGAVVYSRLPGQGVFVAQPNGPDQRVPGLSYGGGVDPTGTYVAGQSSSNEKIGELVGLQNGAVLWRQPGYLGHFSPDGQYLLAGSISDDSSFRVLDATSGDLVGVVTAPTGLGIEQIGWDDDGTLLAVVRDGGSSDGPHHEAIVRFPTDGGQPTLATTPVLVSGLQTGYRLAAMS